MSWPNDIYSLHLYTLFALAHMAETTNAHAVEGTSDEVNPLVSALLSLVVPGLGQIIHNQPKRGGIILGGSILLGLTLLAFSIITLGLGMLLFFFWPLIHIGAAADAYIQAGKINSGEITV